MCYTTVYGDDRFRFVGLCVKQRVGECRHRRNSSDKCINDEFVLAA